MSPRVTALGAASTSVTATARHMATLLNRAPRVCYYVGQKTTHLVPQRPKTGPGVTRPRAAPHCQPPRAPPGHQPARPGGHQLALLEHLRRQRAEGPLGHLPDRDQLERSRWQHQPRPRGGDGRARAGLHRHVRLAIVDEQDGRVEPDGSGRVVHVHYLVHWFSVGPPDWSGTVNRAPTGLGAINGAPTWNRIREVK